MKTVAIMTGGVIAAMLFGCSSTPLPTEAAEIRIDAISSRSLHVSVPSLAMRDGSYLLRGWARRTPLTNVPRGTHVDVRFKDATGSDIELFTTSVWLIPGRPMDGVHRGKYRLKLDAIPSHTVRIEVIAHEGPHNKT